jgi:hypothetical protein
MRGLAVAIDTLPNRTVKGLEKANETPEFKLEVPELPKVPELLLPDYGAIFSMAAQNAAAGRGLLQEEFTTFTQAQADFNTNLEQLLDAFPAAAFANIGEAIGGAILSGTNVLAAAGQALLKTLGDFVAQYGQIIVLKGIADIAFGNIAQGIAEIAGGTALIAAGTIVGGLASGSSSGGGGGSGSINTTPASSRSYSPSIAPAAVAQQVATTNSHTVEFELAGNTLRGALEIETDRLGRVTGRR